MKEEEKEAFRAILLGLAEERDAAREGPFLVFPRFFFMQAFSILRQNKIEGEYWDCLEIFLDFLEEEKISIDYRVRRKMRRAIKVKKEEIKKREKRKLLRGAAKADFRHHKVLGDDY